MTKGPDPSMFIKNADQMATPLVDQAAPAYVPPDAPTATQVVPVDAPPPGDADKPAQDEAPPDIGTAALPVADNNIYSLEAARALREVPADTAGLHEPRPVDAQRCVTHFMSADGRTMRVMAVSSTGELVCQAVEAPVESEGGEA